MQSRRTRSANFRRSIRLHCVDAQTLSEGKPLTETQTIDIDRQTETVILRRELDPELILRYATAINRQIDRILSQLERIQTMRLGQPPIDVQVME